MKSLTELEKEATEARIKMENHQKDGQFYIMDERKWRDLSSKVEIMREVEPLLKDAEIKWEGFVREIIAKNERIAELSNEREEMLAFIDRVCRLENEDLKSYYLMDGLRDDAGILKAKLEGK
jgi:hypothetical protein